MKIGADAGLELEFLNFSAAEGENFSYAARVCIASLFGGAPNMKVKSSVVYVLRNPFDHPRYLTDVPFEMITVNAGENKPFQFLYQLSHEMGHLSSQSSLRWKKVGSHQWIEEALCGAFSIHCLRAAAASQDMIWFRTGAREYLTTYIDKAYSSTQQLTPDWFVEHQPTLVKLNSLDDLIKPVSRIIADEFPDGAFVADNIALGDVALNPNLRDYLDDWSSRCALRANVPSFLKKRFAL